MEVKCKSCGGEVLTDKEVLEERLKVIMAKLRNTIEQIIILLQQNITRFQKMLKESRKDLKELTNNEAEHDLSGILLSPVT